MTLWPTALSRERFNSRQKLSLTITQRPLSNSVSVMMSGLMATTRASISAARSDACSARWAAVMSRDTPQ